MKRGRLMLCEGSTSIMLPLVGYEACPNLPGVPQECSALPQRKETQEIKRKAPTQADSPSHRFQTRTRRSAHSAF